MATYSVASAKHATLAATVADQVTVTSSPTVEVLNRGSAEIHFTINGAVPTGGADDTRVLAGGQALVIGPDQRPATGSAVVRLVSSAATPYSVSAA